MNAAELLCLLSGTTGSLVGMYKLLADESGLTLAKEKFCVVGGLVGSVEQWGIFDQGWKAALNDAGVGVFHALDFWDRRVKDGVVYRPKPYVSWTEQDDIKFIDSLLRVIADSRLRTVSTAVDIEVFLSLTNDERRWLTTSSLYDQHWSKRGKPNDPWFFAFREPILNATEFVPDGDQLFPVFDRRDSPHMGKTPLQNKARELYNEMLDRNPPLTVRAKLGGAIAFASKEDVIGLQAADLLVNRARMYVAKRLGRRAVDQRIRAFLESDRLYMRMMNVIGIDRKLRNCPFRSTFWKIENFRSAKPDYLEKLRGSAVDVLAAKHPRSGNYHSHAVSPQDVRKILKIKVSGGGLIGTEPLDD